MSVAMGQGRLLFLVARQSDLEYRLSTLAMRNVRLAIENAEILTNKHDAAQQHYNAQLEAQQTAIAAGGETDENVALNQNSMDFDTSEFDGQLAQLEAAQKRLDLEQKKLETELKAVNAEKDSTQKLVDNSIKEEFTYCQSSNS